MITKFHKCKITQALATTMFAERISLKYLYKARTHTLTNTHFLFIDNSDTGISNYLSVIEKKVAVIANKDTVNPSRQAVIASRESVMPSPEPAKPSQESVNPSHEAVMPSSEAARLSPESAKPSKEPVNPSKLPAKLNDYFVIVSNSLSISNISKLSLT